MNHLKNPGQTTVSSSIGFLSSALPSLKLIMKAVLSTEPWNRDPELVPLPWRTETEYKKSSGQLCFGIMPTNGIVTPHPPILRGMKLVKEAIEKAGHKVCRITITFCSAELTK